MWRMVLSKEFWGRIKKHGGSPHNQCGNTICHTWKRATLLETFYSRHGFQAANFKF